MKCRNKELKVTGIRYDGDKNDMKGQAFRVLITNDRFGKTVSIDDGHVQYTVPFELLDPWLD